MVDASKEVLLVRRFCEGMFSEHFWKASPVLALRTVRGKAFWHRKKVLHFRGFSATEQAAFLVLLTYGENGEADEETIIYSCL